MRTRVALIALLSLFAHVARAQTAAELETQAVSALKLSQTEPDALISAAILLGSAADAYTAAGEAAKTIEVDSFLYWCKRKLSLAQMDAIVKGGESAQAAIARMKAFEKAAPWPAEAAGYYERALAYSRAHEDEHFLNGVRFYEVAERFKNHELAVHAQEHSLKELSLAAPPPADAAGGAPKPVAPRSAKKVALPAPAQQKAAEKMIRDLYKDEFAKGAIPDKLALAQKLAAQASETTDDIPGHFELLILAANLAAEAGDFEQLFAAFESLAGDFEGDLLPHQKAALSLAASSTKDAGRIKVAQAYRVLLDKPTDSTALLTAGKYECFLKSDFAHGLPRLAKASHPGLSKLAKEELSNPDQPTPQMALADMWWDNAEKSTDKDEKRASQERAVAWYTKALPSLTGLSKIRVETRLGALGVKPPTAPVTSTVPKAPVPVASGSPIGKPTDLIKLIDPARDKGPGEWRVRGKVLECAKEIKYSSIKVRYKPGEQYDLRAVFARLSGEDDIGFNLVCGGHRSLLSLCGWHNSLAGFHGINGKDVDSDLNPTKTPNSLQNNKDYTMDVQVRKYSVRVLLNGKELFKYNFEGSEFTGVAGMPSSTSEPTFGVYCSSSVARFTVLEITELPPAPPETKPDIKPGNTPAAPVPATPPEPQKDN